MGQLVVIFTWFFAWKLCRRDTAMRDGISPALWIPTIWVGLLASRPLSAWVGGGEGGDSLDGNATDRLFYLLMMGVSFYVLSKRRVNWSVVLSRNWAIFLFYGYLLVSVLWAEFPFVSFKRWFKEFGNIVVALVVLTEVNPAQAVRAVFARCAYLLLPMSYVFVRWFSELGRRYSPHTGEMEVTGVTTQKNNLGALVLVCGLILLWDTLELLMKEDRKKYRFDILVRCGLLSVGGYLLYLSDSKTTIVCLAVSILLLLASRIPFFQSRPAAIGVASLVTAVMLGLAEWLFGIKQAAVEGLGRDMSFTGRTDVWRELLNLKTDPIFGTGYLSFWSDQSYRMQLPEWVASSAHNGYLEIYIDGGWIAVFFLALMLFVVGVQAFKRLATGGTFGVVCFAIFLSVLIDNFSESYIARMTPVGFLFFLGAIHYRRAGETRRVKDFNERERPATASPLRPMGGAA